MELFFLVVIFVMYISVPELEKFFLWTSLKCQGLHSRYRCGAGFGDAILLQVSMDLFANGKSNVLPKGRTVINIGQLTACEQIPS
jgi:hypothetical protein